MYSEVVFTFFAFLDVNWANKANSHLAMGPLEPIESINENYERIVNVSALIYSINIFRSDRIFSFNAVN